MKYFSIGLSCVVVPANFYYDKRKDNEVRIQI